MTRHDTPMAGNATVTVLRLLLMGAVIFVVSSLLPLAREPSQAGLKAIVYALASSVAVLLLRPQRDASSRTVIAWCATGTLLGFIFLCADSTTRILWPLFPRLVLTMFLLTATFSLAIRYVAVPLVVCVFVFLTLMPVWAAPLVELMGNPAWLSKMMISVSPLTAIAVAIDIDYLRSEWFYAHSALGSMRYSYPGWALVCFLLSALPSGAIILERLRPAPTASYAIQEEAHS